MLPPDHPLAQEKLKLLAEKERHQQAMSFVIYLCLKHPDVFPEEAAGIKRLLAPALQIIEDVILEADPAKPNYIAMEKEIDRRVQHLQFVQLQEKIRKQRADEGAAADDGL